MDLYLLRHAMPVVDAATPPATWVLSPDGAAAAAQLGASSGLTPACRAGEVVAVASDEPKARATAALVAGCNPDEVDASADFREVRREEAFDPRFAVQRRAWVSGEEVPGWEPFDSVAGRFAQGVVGQAERAAAHAATAVLVGTHGMALTAYLVANGLLAAGEEAGEFWSALTFPDLWVVRDLGTSSGRLLRAVRTAAD